ncbi:MAG: 1-(5-phosphoribosyl)-5-amino-4-imidazole-carboxylate carboxylase [Bacteroidetes bacterium GWE2_41_25]|nr:MAG: 1-(5-phosphoribosyl)-5-amino-4-imidazole-carboxylate carboxylase [Bacteroidetes bacterium GWA2_40_15]OFX94817.1 MAG: 1-(5-phosphoribosyl)-5-amino-4-imidazole-carboxylate carboxylase [Bacteroidetes bacterium GWC2_40_22]OFY00470.1 MAG: 1-(5-phosphoribosyl)-5-amino-4-imidazole-carboxylate carboxylase [Bacteroidetes bacterium GWE2_41_25]OFY60921.1 MAG: 1-(5-phosphoribosyl)-5-amino-4-imidazole-carboxylate carboxylase [Bacteroidetes bacterium GWF2_41_9]HBH85084.1 nickel pincer cofactor biosyn
MNIKEIEKLLNDVKSGNTSVDDALDVLRNFSYTDLGFARIDHHRELRTGYPEIVYCAGKTVEQVREIFRVMAERENNVIGTRANQEMFDSVKSILRDAVYYPIARIISIQKKRPPALVSMIAVITAGTSDMPVAEEAAVTAELLGNSVLRIYDAGVAGIHRLVDKLPEIRKCKVVVVIAGMEGALASVVGGLVDKPVIAVPTSVGYGANFGGISALLAMLTSCSTGVTVVNIDNGFGAGFSASMINKCE